MFEYTTRPIPTQYPEHLGFFLIIIMFIISFLIMIYNAKEEGYSIIKLTCLMMIAPVFSYFVSYQWTNQNPITYKNERFIASFIRFVPEAYNEARHEGKTTRQVDVHEQFVEYEVNKSRILLTAQIGQSYPQKIYLYKNEK